ncbi:sporulation protein YabP [Metabacillus niabensis]|uniref:Sporulation protein YabP n=1 Tax=Metabacillus niabensis TaxID=324854 RepID=A0ABT9ZA57_9BACI|nr:sporulation protein YabP [Metabacillus niabensis]MDQ0228513.1 sporulation protein YabP [Metabacillus niabensis]PAD66690.1 sporulation protein YabP [Bacillus sp. 7586-K]
MNNYYDNHSSVNKGPNLEHDVIMKGRKLIEITGVKQVESFDSEEFLLDTVMGALAIRGQNLQMKNLDVDKGVVSIKGSRIFDLIYLDEQHGEKAKGLFSKLFK